jgi:hypothetical protein
MLDHDLRVSFGTARAHLLQAVTATEELRTASAGVPCQSGYPGWRSGQFWDTYSQYFPSKLLSQCIIIIIIIISFKQGIHTYVPGTNHVSRVYIAAAILRVLLMVHIALSAILNYFVLLH